MIFRFAADNGYLVRTVNCARSAAADGPVACTYLDGMGISWRMSARRAIAARESLSRVDTEWG